MAVHFSFPSRSLFLLPPSSNSYVTQPLSDLTSDHEVLDITIPVVISCIYAVLVKFFNSFNRSRNNHPWQVSKTNAFSYFVVAHNVLLASYSAWTFISMFKALQRSVRNPIGSTGAVGFVDSLCKLHGTAGLGNGTALPSTCLQRTYDPRFPCNSIDQGRLWNEGLDFYGHIFYWSKFYEFLDTAIILAKGKQGSLLQVYHHIGALICMWAGMRYMSSPIWIPTLLNSGVHALMYSYYSLTVLAIPVPKSVKQSLTALQIIQLIFSDLLAALYLFISYDIPVGGRINATAITAIIAGSRVAVPAGLHLQEVSCIDTTGQAFAIWLSVLYLTPLIGLFIRFFYRSYRRAGSRAGTKGSWKIKDQKLL